jgi:dephospho-CoA kinase
VLDEAGELDRDSLAAIVFRDPEARARLNAIMHPPIGAEMLRRADAARRAGVPLVIVDAPVLFEALRAGGSSATRLGFETVLVVYAREGQQIERQMAREGYDRAEAERRVRAQIPIDEKRQLADLVIDNSGSLEETERQVRELYANLLAEGQ